MSLISATIERVREEIRLACERSQRPLEAVALIAVTKSQGPDVLPALIASGCHDFGENRVEHLTMMHDATPATARFHAIGRIQSRQLRTLVERCVSLHSLCEESHVPKLAEHCQALSRRLSVFIQVNASGEAAKAGLTPEATPRFLELARHHALEVVGLMTMAPEMPAGTADDGRIRACFRTLATLARQLALPRLSMGMSQDFQIAIEEGATDVRIGTRLFI